MGEKCVFLDRDNTLIEEAGYLTDPQAVKMLPGVDMALQSLVRAGYRLVVVTNQSAVARGLIAEDDLRRIHEEMSRQLSERGVRLDGIYYCPYHPEGTVKDYARDSQDRKPKPGMLLRAASEMNIDLTGSWMVGDSSRDVKAGKRAGCRTIRIAGPDKDAKADEADEEVAADFVVGNLVDAARVVLRESKSAEADATRAADDQPPPERMTDGEVLREILRHLRQFARAREGTGEFSICRLIGAVFQILAVIALIWGLFYIPSVSTANDPYTAWHLGLITAGALQLIALTFFVLSQQR